MSLKAPVTNISRGSLHDGEGVRTVIYFKGCPLRCRWCHNPETLSFEEEILYVPAKCIHCGRCIELCPEHHKIVGDEMFFDRDGCVLCGKCTQACPSLALTLSGEDKTVDELFSEIEKDRHYYSLSGGGVTFSGGECLIHSDFLVALAKKCREAFIHTAVESAFFVPWENVEKVLPYIDFFFADLKIADSEKHREYTGQGNELIIENIRMLSNIHNDITLRIPIIPSVNDTVDDMSDFAEIIKTFGKGVRSVELLRYNNLAESKYSFVGREFVRFADKAQDDEKMTELSQALEKKSLKKCFFI